MSARMLKLHTVLCESINSMLSNLSRTSPNISLELLSARVSTKKRLGFLREQAWLAKANNIALEDVEACTTSTKSKGSWASHSFRPKASMNLISGMSMREAQPFARLATQQLEKFLRDVNIISNDMYRFAAPPPLTSIPLGDPGLLNKEDRPFALLSDKERRLFINAQRYHRQWFAHLREHHHGKASILLYFMADDAPQAQEMFDARKAFRIYFVGEIFHSQAPLPLTCNLTFCSCLKFVRA